MLRSGPCLLALALAATGAAGCSLLVADQLNGRAGDSGIDANVPDTGPIGETCTTNAQCVSFDVFNCHRLCVSGHCTMGNTPDGTACGMSGAMHCVQQMCVNRTCGDGFVDRTATPPEYCDDGNTNPADSCNNSCTRSCVAPAPANCDDHVPCNGTESCDGNVCVATGPDADLTPCMLGTNAGTCMMGTCVTP